MKHKESSFDEKHPKLNIILGVVLLLAIGTFGY